MTTDQPTGSTDRTDHDDHSSPVSTSTIRYLYLGGLTLAGLIAFISVIQAYISAGQAINQFASEEYRSVFQTGFNLIVLLLSIIAISRLGRRLAVLSASSSKSVNQSAQNPSATVEENADDVVREVDVNAESTGEDQPGATERTAEPDSSAETAATDWDGGEETS